MVIWTRDERLTFDIAFVLKKVTIPGFHKGLKEEDRIVIAQTILEHLKLCRWSFRSQPNPSNKSLLFTAEGTFPRLDAIRTHR